MMANLLLCVVGFWRYMLVPSSEWYTEIVVYQETWSPSHSTDTADLYNLRLLRHIVKSCQI